MAAGVLIKPRAVDEKRVGGPAVGNQAFEDISQHLLHRQIDPSVRRKNEPVLILQVRKSVVAWVGAIIVDDIDSEYTGPSRVFNRACSRCRSRARCLIQKIVTKREGRRLGERSWRDVDRADKATELPPIAGPIQDGHLQIFRREFLIGDLFQGGDSRVSAPAFRVGGLACGIVP